MSLRTKLLLSVLPLSLLALIFLAIFQYLQGKSSILNAQEEGMRQTITIIEKQTDDWLNWNRAAIELLSKEQAFHGALEGNDGAKREAQAELTHAHDISGQFDSIVLIDQSKRVVLNSVVGRSLGLDLGTIEGFSRPINQANHSAMIGEAFFSPATNRPIIFIASPIKLDGVIKGYIGATLALDKLSENVISKLKFGETGYPFILREDGVVWAHPVTKHLLVLDIKKLGWSDQVLGKKNGVFTQTFQGVEKIYLFNFSDTHKLFFMASAPTEEFLRAINATRNTALLITILAIIALSSILIFITQTITQRIAKVSKGVAEGAAEILEASESIAKASQTLSSAATQQASSIQETSASMEELTAMVGQNLESAKASSEMADNLTKISDMAANYTKELSSSMDKLKESNVEIKDLEKIIESISEKTKVIDEIVFQTKLLSFNASVEAERAGEHGRGFAVVAQEVGNLAQMSGSAAQEISGIIKNSITRSHEVTARNDKFVAEGAQVLAKLKEIVASIEKASKQVEEQSKKITSASNEQHIGIKQINEAVTQLDQATQQNASVSEAAASASEQMHQQANSLGHLIDELEEITHGEHTEKSTPHTIPTHASKEKPTTKVQAKTVSSNADDLKKQSSKKNDWDEL